MKSINRKDMFTSESVKAKIHGQHSCPALTDSTLNMAESYNRLQWNEILIFFNQTQFNELSRNLLFKMSFIMSLDQ